LGYIQIYFPGKDIHAMLFLLHFPSASAERQWSHVDGTREMWQGSIMCGDGHASTLEFSVLEQRVSNAELLKKVWPTQHDDFDVFLKLKPIPHAGTFWKNMAIYLIISHQCP
jgi:hypothetical protein